MAFKIVVSEKELSYQLEVDDGKQLNGLKIGEEFDGQIVGLDGYTLKITGGSDKNGFAMKKDVDGPRRIKSLLTGGVGYKPKGDGVKRRKTVRGNTISDFSQEEINHHYSISASLVPVVHKGVKINFIDFPGMNEFVQDLYNDLAVKIINKSNKDKYKAGNTNGFKTNFFFIIFTSRYIVI